jgi:hypothetical protein
MDLTQPSTLSMQNQTTQSGTGATMQGNGFVSVLADSGRVIHRIQALIALQIIQQSESIRLLNTEAYTVV